MLRNWGTREGVRFDDGNYRQRHNTSPKRLSDGFLPIKTERSFMLLQESPVLKIDALSNPKNITDFDGNHGVGTIFKPPTLRQLPPHEFPCSEESKRTQRSAFRQQL